MVDIERGFRGKLSEYFDLAKEIVVSISISGSGDYDSCCFGVDSSDKLSDDSYMVFYNQTSSPKGEIVLSGSGANTSYAVKLSQLPTQINKLVFTVSIDGDGVMGQLQNLTLTLSQGTSALKLNLKGADFHAEKAVITVEMYKKEVWRLATVARGFDGGLAALLKLYGGEEDSTASTLASSVASTGETSKGTNKVSLEKRLEKEAPQLVSLAKPLKVSLEKHKLMDIVARVALVLDISGSMTRRYNNGAVQEIVNRTVPIAVQFDNDGELDLWYYGKKPRRMPSVNTGNYQNAVPNDWHSLMASLGYGNYEPAVIELVREEYGNSQLPAYVIFITDGGVGSKAKIQQLLTDASKEPIFWQFIGVGGSGYGILEKLDTMSGRYVDNANFFALDDFRSINATELYSRMLAEFPIWLKKAKDLGILR